MPGEIGRGPGRGLARHRDEPAVFVVGDGAAAEAGTHDELLELPGGVYRTLSELRFDLTSGGRRPPDREMVGDAHPAMNDAATELLNLTQRLLDAISAGDWPTYVELCAADLTAFEPEACGQLIEGLPFHQFYFNLPNRGQRKQVTMAAPRVRLLGDAAVVTYVRVNQSAGPDAVPESTAFNETRVWQLLDGRWRHVHFHRSPAGG